MMRNMWLNMAHPPEPFTDDDRIQSKRGASETGFRVFGANYRGHGNGDSAHAEVLHADICVQSECVPIV